MRKAFERWAQENVGQPSFAGQWVRDGKWSYSHNIMQLCWQCWQDAQGDYDHGFRAGVAYEQDAAERRRERGEQ